MEFLLAIDQGTTGTTAALISLNDFHLTAKVNKEYPQIYPSPGLVEHNLNDIWKSVESCVKECLLKANAKASSIKAIGLTNQRETTCAFDKQGAPLANAIVWQDRRTHEHCQKLKDQKLEARIKSLTGLPLDPYFSATKMNWLLKNNDQVKQAAKSNDLCFGTIDTFLLFKLTNGKSYFTEGSNASRTLLMDLDTCQWSDELLKIFEIDRSLLPVIKDSFGEFGVTSGLRFLPDGIPITGILGDQQSALFGQAGITSGDMKCTYGTGAFLLLNTAQKKIMSQNGLLTTIAYLKDGKPAYALEGSCYIAGAAVQWFRDNLGLIAESSAIESLAYKVKNLDEMKNLLFLPFFTGLGSPYWISDGQAAFVGLTRDTDKPHLARACLDGMALSINDLIEAMREDTKLKISSLNVDGGAVQNDLLLTIQASVSEVAIVRPLTIETTAYGAALAAAVGAGLFDLDQMKSLWKEDKTFKPDTSLLSFYKNKKEQWKSIIKRLYL